VGPSGSGKSTIINLLLRFYDPEEGEILLDGINIKELNIRWLRTQISMVGQEPVLFSESVAANVAKGRAQLIETDVTPLEHLLAQSDATVFSKSVDRLSIVASSPGTTAVDDDIIEAAKVAYAHDFILKFPHGNVSYTESFTLMRSLTSLICRLRY
jgi:ABC-type multidrug transport system fused ATPase/permease subunit